MNIILQRLAWQSCLYYPVRLLKKLSLKNIYFTINSLVINIEVITFEYSLSKLPI